MKVCSGCSKELSLENFYRHKRHADGYNSRCKVCHKHTIKVAEEKADYDRVRRSKKLEELRAYDKLRASWPDRKATKNEHTRKRRASLLGATPQNYDKEGVLSMYKLAQKISTITGVLMHVDHIVPLSKGGKHDVDNLQLLAAKLNVAKGSNPHWQLPWNAYPK